MSGYGAGPAAFSVNNSTFSGNIAETGGAGGGGLDAVVTSGGMSLGGPPVTPSPTTSATLTLTNSTFSGNSVTPDSGGGIELEVDTASSGSLAQAFITGCTISGNSAGLTGGIFARELDVPDSVATVTVTNSTVYANRAGDGAGVSNIGRDNPGAPSGITLLSDTVAFNTATTLGGGLREQAMAGAARFTVHSTIVANNTAHSDPDAAGLFLSGGYNLIGQSNGSSGWLASGLKGTTADPLDARFGDFGNFGGPTKTLALLADSPAIGAGDPAGPTTDQRGVARSRTAPTIGAFEGAQATLMKVFPIFPGIQAGITFGIPGEVVNNSAAALAIVLNQLAEEGF